MRGFLEMQGRLFEYRRRPSTPGAPDNAKSLIDGGCPCREQRLEETRLFSRIWSRSSGGTQHVCNLAPAEERVGFAADWFGAVLRLPALEYDGRRDGFPTVT
ncbi:hypothetical protein ACFYZB_39185 [Streptomyces sp. NPDC001852]|uniref:hypothetical protein n=1 Tax=Streptomyces sp. NPDC001852 TaxID=3364619 RepID=UPI0036A2D18D